MFSSVFLFIMLLAFKHTHLISDFDVFPCIPLVREGQLSLNQGRDFRVHYLAMPWIDLWDWTN